jgi:hypothetical protein
MESAGRAAGRSPILYILCTESRRAPPGLKSSGAGGLPKFEPNSTGPPHQLQHDVRLVPRARLNWSHNAQGNCSHSPEVEGKSRRVCEEDTGNAIVHGHPPNDGCP